jgi:hypothetical protein
LVEGIGDYEIRVEVHDVAQDEIVFKSGAVRISFADRLMQRRSIFSLPGLPMPHSGKYDVIVFGDGREIDRQQIDAVQAGSGEKP